MTVTQVSNDYIELRFGPRWTYISCVRKFVASFFMIGLAAKERSREGIERVSVEDRVSARRVSIALERGRDAGL